MFRKFSARTVLIAIFGLFVLAYGLIETKDFFISSAQVEFGGGGQFKIKHPLFNQMSGYDIPAIKTEDFNNDGINDVALVLPNDDKLAVQLGDGQGSLSAPNYITTPDNPTDLAIVDFNLDGEFDIAVTNGFPGLVSLFTGDGAGSFTFASSFSANGSALLLTVGNYNQDEFPDIAVANSNNFRVFFGSGTTNFSQSVQTNTFFSARRMTQADFDRDGKIDLLIYFYSGDGKSTRIYKGGGDGSFVNTFTIPDLELNGLTFGDFNNDTFLDLVLSDYNQNSLKFYSGNGNGGFGSPISSPAFFSWSITNADFNKDGNLDVASDSGSIFLGNGSGNFSVLSRSAVSAWRAAAAADFNSDGFPDLAAIVGTSSHPSDATAVILNDGTGKTITGTQADYTGSRNFKIDSADFNLDGKFDLVTSDAEGNRVFVLLQDTNGFFNSTAALGVPIGFGGVNQGPYSAIVGDFNEDGKPDIASPNTWTSQVAILLGSGTGTFTRTNFNLSANNFRPYSIGLGDFNNDNHQDLITMHSAGFSFSVLLGDGTGNFTVLTGQNISNQSGSNYVTIGDFNSDGKQDLIVSRFFQTNLLVLLGNADGTFTTSPNQIVVPANTTALKSPDFNGDGKPDLAAITGENPSTLRIGLGNGDGTFSALTAYPLNVSASADMSIEDFDLDGTKDILIGDTTNGALILFKGNGTGVFAAQPPIRLSPTPYSLVSRDFNGDGKPDVATASFLFAGTRAFLNDTNTLPELSVNDVSVAEGNTGETSNAVFTVSLAEPSSQTITVNYRTIKRTAVEGADYVAASGQITFPPNTTSQTVNLQVSGDNLDETDETFVLSLSGAANAAIADAVGVGTILDNDAPPTFSASNFSLTEGNSGISQAMIPAVLSAASGKKVKIQFNTADLTANAPGDYLSASGILYFAPGTISKNVRVVTVADRIIEPDETFAVNFSNPVNTIPTTAQSIVTIINDDFAKTADFDGDGKTDLSIFRPAPGEWWFYRSSDGGNFALQFGISTDKIVPADYTGDGKTDVAVWRGSTGQWFVLRSEDFSYFAFPFGASGDMPVPADYDGDGKADAAVFRPSNSTWYIQKSTGGTQITPFGISGDLPTAADFDGDGKSDIAIFRPTGANGAEWWIRRSSDASVTAFQFGAGTDKAVPADYTGDGKADVAVWRPSDGNWFILRSEDLSFYSFPFGANGDLPVPADYDGDHKTDAGVFRPSNQNWFVQRSTAGILIQHFGTVGDLPVPNAFVP